MGHPDIFVLGDTALVIGRRRQTAAGRGAGCQAAGAVCCRPAEGRLDGRVVPAFRYRDFGSMATIGRKSAVAELGRLRLSGFAAWLLWCMAHIYFLIGFRSRFVVALNWAWNYVTFQRGSRLITGISGSRIEDMTKENSAEDPVQNSAQNSAQDSAQDSANEATHLQGAA